MKTPNLLKLLTSITLASLPASAISAETVRVYLGTGDKGIYTSLLDQESGSLSEPTLAAKIQGSGFLAIHPNKKHLYTTGHKEKGTGLVLSYSIAADGSLRETSAQPIQGKRLCHVSLDHTSHTLMAANYSQGNVVSLPVKNDGSLGKLTSFHQHTGSSSHPQRQTKPHAHSIYSGPDNRFAYAPDLGIDKVMIYRLDPKSAKLTPAGHATSPSGAGPRHMKFGKDGKYAYVLNELSVSISVYERNKKTGQLTAKQLIDTLPQGMGKKEMSCSEIRISRDGKFAYCANRDLTEAKRDSVSAFSIGKDGTLTHLQTIHAEVWIPRNINIDPSGKWLLVAGQRSNNVPVFKINPQSGKLSFTGNKIDLPAPMCIEFK
ncbi:MAG: lactonase family protein [Akkermansiaceae bacterium]